MIENPYHCKHCHHHRFDGKKYYCMRGRSLSHRNDPTYQGWFSDEKYMDEPCGHMIEIKDNNELKEEDNDI